ncbi:MAG: hypothetical protein NC356_01610 [Ruminococcus sp.]|nr:hypothetical protein [Ruminococcus sp.]
MIQWNLNLFLNPSNKADGKNRYRTIQLHDDVTEGYNVIPNFFISAKIDPLTLSYDDKTERHPGEPNVCRQFENRLYDRDTLIVSHYDVNFLFELSLYARANTGAKASWKSAVRKRFRKEIQEMLKERFSFYAMTAHPDVDDEKWLKENFQSVLGKTYSPFLDKGIFSVALDNDPKFTKENADLLETLSQNFYITKCPLGDDPSGHIEIKCQEVGDVESPATDKGKFLTCLVRKEEPGEDNRMSITKLYQSFHNQEAEGKTYIMLNMPGGDISVAKYLMLIVDLSIDGYYEIVRLSFGTRKHKVGDMEVNIPTLRIKIGKFHPLDTRLTEGIVPRMANQIWSRSYLNELFKK